MNISKRCWFRQTRSSLEPNRRSQISIIKSRIDTDGARALVSRRWGDVKEYADELLGWCIDRNFPVAWEVLIPYFVNTGVPAAPFVRSALHDSMINRDYGAAYTLILCIVAKWPRDAVVQIQDELTAIAKAESIPGEEHDFVALSILAENQIPFDRDVGKKALALARARPELQAELSVRASGWIAGQLESLSLQ
jgi:hypothetical protein